DTNKKSRDKIDKLLEPTLWVQLLILYVTWRGVGMALGTLKQIKKQTDVNTLAANAAQRSADVAEVSLRIRESPRVFCSAIDIDHVAVNERPVIIAHFLNQGGIPAERAVIAVGFQMFENPTQPSLQMCIGLLDDPNIRQGEFTIASGQEICLPIAYPR